MALPLPLSTCFNGVDVIVADWSGLGCIVLADFVCTLGGLGTIRRVMTTSGTHPVKGPGVASLARPGLTVGGVAGRANPRFCGERVVCGASGISGDWESSMVLEEPDALW